MIDNGTEYAVRAERVAIEANAEFIEPIRLAMLAVSEERNAHWRIARDAALDERDRALYLCERARATARRFEEELALIRRAATARRHG